MYSHNDECCLRTIAASPNGRVMRCSEHPGYILEFGPVVVRIRVRELEKIADMVDQLAAVADEPCAECSHEDCRARNFAIDIPAPRMRVEFGAEGLPELQELLVETRLALLLQHNRIGRPAQD